MSTSQNISAAGLRVELIHPATSCNAVILDPGIGASEVITKSVVLSQNKLEDNNLWFKIV